jgi:hypothetical protein
MLYGVTMAVRGVSHVVSVELAQIDEIIPQPRREAGSSPEAPTRAAGGTLVALESHATPPLS